MGTDWEHPRRNDRQSWGLFIVAGDARDAVIIAAEDGWQDTVGPRLQVAGADLTNGHVFSVGDNGEGVPGVFLRTWNRCSIRGLCHGRGTIDNDGARLLGAGGGVHVAIRSAAG